MNGNEGKIVGCRRFGASTRYTSGLYIWQDALVLFLNIT